MCSQGKQCSGAVRGDLGFGLRLEVLCVCVCVCVCVCHAARKENGMAEAAKRRLSADAVRTLESIYNRNPFPPDDVIK